eukprot:TRINITY_DN4493_c2_g1_i2.p1 TRINITY_DN4493_c2_g1~~TRINITY_DN4493_c2_g1_i2.p1  ORF type:complete len:1124 (+),score=298.97 TRINITY_DN4493_c2_g1_i2:116-3487(+)
MSYLSGYGADYGYSRGAPPPPYCSGLQNQGATCYLNGLLQALYHLSYFRTCVYRVPTANEDSDGDQRMCASLQRLFYAMETEKTPVSTRDLTQSFGWTSGDSYRQQDVQELLMLFVFGALESLFQRSMPEHNAVRQLFKGQRVTCMRINQGELKGWESQGRVEPFHDLQLDIRTRDRALGSTEAALEYMLSSEMLTGENKYCYEDPQTKEQSYHDAERVERLRQLPPVLIFHLRRFSRSHSMRPEKVPDRFQFAAELDMSRFVHRPSERRRSGSPDEPGSPGTPASTTLAVPDDGQDCMYDLHAVMVHAGFGASSGHYYSFVRLRGEEEIPPPGSTIARKRRWFKFDDSRVTEATERQAIDENFGGGDILSSDRTAYVLVYVRSKIADDIVYKPRRDERPTELLDRAEKQRQEQERKDRERREARHFCSVTVVTPSDLASALPVDLQIEGLNSVLSSASMELLAAADRNVRVRKADNVEDLVEKVQSMHGGSSGDAQSVWLFPPRGGTRTPQDLLGGVSGSRRIDYTLDPHNRQYSQTCTGAVFVSPYPAVGTGKGIAFLRVYDPATGTLPVRGHAVVVLRTDTCRVLVPELPSSEGGKERRVWWRASYGSLEPLEELSVVDTSGIVYVVQCVSTPEAEQWLKGRSGRRGSLHSGDAAIPPELAGYELPSPVDWLHWNMHSRRVLFVPRQPSSGSESVDARVLETWDAARLQSELAGLLKQMPSGAGPGNIRLWRDGRPMLKSDTLRPLSQGQPAWSSRNPPSSDGPTRIHFELLHVPLQELDKRHHVCVEARGPGMRLLSQPKYLLLPDKLKCRVEDVLREASETWPDLGPPSNLHLCEIRKHEIVKIKGAFALTAASRTYGDISDWDWLPTSTYRVERRPHDVDSPRDQLLVPVAHFERVRSEYGLESVRLHGDPFLMHIRRVDSPKDVLKRARRFLGLLPAGSTVAPGDPPVAAADFESPRNSALLSPEPTRGASEVPLVGSPPPVLSPHSHTGATSDEELSRLLEAAKLASLSPMLAPSSATPARAVTPLPAEAPADDGATWGVALLQSWGSDKWDALRTETIGRSFTTAHGRVVVGLEHPALCDAGKPRAANRGRKAEGVVIDTRAGLDAAKSPPRYS